MYRVGIDLGGTNIAVGVVNDRYDIVSHVSVPTGAARSAEQIVKDIAGAVGTALEKAGLAGSDCCMIGIGAPGTCDVERGLVIRSYSLNWTNVPLLAMLREYFSVPVRIDNDANCAALAEVKAGAAVGKRNVVLITLGTGVGSGIVIDGKIYTGLRGSGSEFGHTMLRLDGEVCSCGRRGCVDAYASATALIRQAKQAAVCCPESRLNRLPQITGKDVFDCAAAGDAAAEKVIDRYCYYLGVCVSDVINALAPEMILIGGGISRQGERLLRPVRDYIAQNCFDKRPEALAVIATASMGNEAGIIGAAAL